MGPWRRLCYRLGHVYAELLAIHAWPEEHEYEFTALTVASNVREPRSLFGLRIAEEVSQPPYDGRQWRVTITLLFFLKARFSIE
jgi:hypothetical protein